ncbi:MAG: M1 family aminopeptidase [Candidatus Krumholzibacteriia bacterium]
MTTARLSLLLLVCTLAPVAMARWLPPADKTRSAVADWPGRIPAADDRGIDVLDYDLALEFTQLPPLPGEVAGEMVVRLALLDPPPAAVRLDLVDQLTVSRVLRDGAPVPYTHADDSLLVPLTAPTAGEVLDLTVTYSGRPPRHGPLWAGLLARQHGQAQPSVGNVSQPFSSHSWFPCKDHPADRATLSLSVTAPDTLTVVATGRLLGTEAVAGDRRAWRWRTEHPVATYLVGVAVSDFASWFEDCDGVPLEFHVFAEHREDVAPALAPTCAMLTWLGDLVGPYPFADEKYAQAEFVWGGAMENQTVTTLGTASILLPTRSAQLVVVHELSHHWFGDNLTPRRWRDIWLNEGFARFAEVLWLEHAEGPAAAAEYLDRLRPADLFVGDGLLGDPDPILDILVYDKGAWVLHMLRGYLGDDAFFAALREYAGEGGLTDRDHFTDVWSRSSGRDVGAFLAPWLDTEVVPDLAVRWRDRGGQRRLVEVVQEQAGAVFRLAVPLRVHAGAEVRSVTVGLEGEVGGVDVWTAAPIDSVEIDPDAVLLRRTTTTAAPRLLAAQPRPNPAREQVALAFWLAADDRVTARVFDLRGRLVRTADLGLQPATDEATPNVWTWDGRDRDGRPAAAGVYWLELRTVDDRSVRKVTLLR